MAIVRTPLRSTRTRLPADNLNTIMDRFFGVPNGSPASDWFPPVNVREDADGLQLTAELPGVRAEDVEIEFENNMLTIRGTKGEERTEGADNDRYHIWERRFGSFQRSFTLPRTVKAEDIDASFEAGILTVRLPKSAEAKSRKIAISQGTSEKQLEA